MTQDAMIEPCPFCGNAGVGPAFVCESGRWDIWQVECGFCDISIEGPLGFEGDAAKQAAVERWNTRAYNPDEILREAWQPIETAWRVGDQKIIVTDGAEVHGAAWWHSGEEAWLDCGGITPTLCMPLPKPPGKDQSHGATR